MGALGQIRAAGGAFAARAGRALANAGEAFARSGQPRVLAPESAPAAAHPGALIKAGRPDDPQIAPTDREAAGLLLDPFGIWAIIGQYRERPSAMTVDLLRQMASTPLLSPIIKRRCDQLGQFGERQRTPHSPGFQVALRDVKRAPTRAELKAIDEVSTFLEQTGAISDLRELKIRPNFRCFLKSLARDALVFDQACFQVIPNRFGRPAEFLAMPAHTIRLARHEGPRPPGPRDFDAVRYVQVYEDVVIAEFTAQELCFGVRNPRTDIEVAGYGFSEVEQVAKVLTAFLLGWNHNERFFTQGAAVKGILNLKGLIPDKMLDAFKRQWYAMAAGGENAWRTPIMASDGIEWIDLHLNNTEMQFDKWIDLQIKLACATFAMDPAEIQFVYGNAGQAQAMGSADVEAKVTASREAGLRPLAEEVFGWLNTHVIWPINPDLVVQAAGLQKTSLDDERDVQEKESRFLKTVDELRAANDLAPLPDGKGACILNPAWLQFAQSVGQGGGDGGAQGGGEGSPPIDADALFGEDTYAQPGDTSDAGVVSPQMPAEPLARSARGARRDAPRTVIIDL